MLEWQARNRPGSISETFPAEQCRLRKKQLILHSWAYIQERYFEELEEVRAYVELNRCKWLHGSKSGRILAGQLKSEPDFPLFSDYVRVA